MTAYGYIYTHIYIIKAFESCARPLHNTFTPRKLVPLHQADIARVQNHPNSMQTAVVPVQIPRHAVI